MKSQRQIDEINRIAKYILYIKNLDTQHSDSKDFHTLGVWAIADALNAAYQAGYAASFDKRFKETD